MNESEREQEGKRIATALAPDLQVLGADQIGVIAVDEDSVAVHACPRSEIADLLPTNGGELSRRLHKPAAPALPGYREIEVIVLFVHNVEGDWHGANLQAIAAMTVVLVARGAGPRGSA